MMKFKKHLSADQEFQVMLRVLDKFLWVGTVVMLYGLYILFKPEESLYKGFSFIVAGAMVLLLFLIIIVKEYEIIK